MSEEIIEDMLEEVAPQVAGDYPEIAQRYKAGEELTDEELQKGINAVSYTHLTLPTILRV